VKDGRITNFVFAWLGSVATPRSGQPCRKRSTETSRARPARRRIGGADGAGAAWVAGITQPIGDYVCHRGNAERRL